MNNATTKIQKITSKGQITVPISWRRRIKTDTIIVKTNGDVIEIMPARLEKTNNETEYTVFDALRDNKGKGLKAVNLIKILDKLDK